MRPPLEVSYSDHERQNFAFPWAKNGIRWIALLNPEVGLVKRIRYEDGAVDGVDARLLASLAEDARISLAELARRVGLSPPSVSERLRRLEEAGVIAGYTIRVNPAALGLPIAAWLRVRPVPGEMKRVAEILQGLREIVQCDRVTGEDCFIARVHVKSMEHLEEVIDAIIPLAMTNTSIVQSSPVEARLPAGFGDGPVGRSKRGSDN
jgi:Lrp/AsnC family leucine-responsive transcriptional regulator